MSIKKLVSVKGHPRLLKTGKRVLVKLHVRSSKSGAVVVNTKKHQKAHAELMKMKSDSQELEKEYHEAVVVGDVEKQRVLIEKAKHMVKKFGAWVEAHPTLVEAGTFYAIGAVMLSVLSPIACAIALPTLAVTALGLSIGRQDVQKRLTRQGSEYEDN